jgi:hypothetical protein
MKIYGGLDLYIHVFLTSDLVGGEWSVASPSHFIPSKRAPWYLLDRRMRRRENSFLYQNSNFDPSVVHEVKGLG